MTINSQVRRAGPFAGAGGTGPFPFTFKVFQASDLLVERTDASLVSSALALGTDYTVALNADQNVSPGGSVTLLSALALGFSLVLTSNVPATQPLALTNTGGFYPRAVEDELDRLTILLQQMGAAGVNVGQALRVPELVGVPALPGAAYRVGKYLSFDGDGNPALIDGVAGPDTLLRTDLSTSSDPSKGDELVAVKLAKTGGTARTQHQKNADMVSVTDFGANIMGVASVQATFQAACDAGVKHLWIPDGDFLFTGSFTPAWNMTITASSGANLKAGANNITFISVPVNCYGTVFRGLRMFGNGYTGVKGYDLSNWRVAAAMYDCSVNNMDYGAIFRTGCFGNPIVSFTAQDVDNAIQILANGSAMQIINPVLDNSSGAGGTNLGTAIYIAAGASDNIGIMVSSGYYQGYNIGVDDRGIGTIVKGCYSELCTAADIYGNACRGSAYTENQFFGPTGAAGIKLRSTDSVLTFANQMASGARTVLYDADNTNTNWVRLDIPSSAAYGTPTGTLTYSSQLPIQSKGSSAPVVVGTGSAGTAAYSTQVCNWTRTGDVVQFELTMVWTGHTGTGNVSITTNMPTTLNPATYTAPFKSFVVNMGVPFTGPGVIAYLNGTGTQMTLLQTSTAGAQSLVPIAAAGSLSISGSYRI